VCVFERERERDLVHMQMRAFDSFLMWNYNFVICIVGWKD